MTLLMKTLCQVLVPRHRCSRIRSVHNHTHTHTREWPTTRASNIEHAAVNVARARVNKRKPLGLIQRGYVNCRSTALFSLYQGRTRAFPYRVVLLFYGIQNKATKLSFSSSVVDENDTVFRTKYVFIY